MRKLLTVVLSLAAFIGFSITSANAKTLKCQTVISAKADEVKMLTDFTDTVTALTNGSLKFEIMPAGTVVE
jgi:TRAP-type C4-dicarboxylate transport system substrate-binding protein